MAPYESRSYHIYVSESYTHVCMFKWMSCIIHTYRWVMAHMDESWHTHTYGWVMAHMDESWHIHTYGWVMAHMDESWHIHTYGWVMAHSHIWMSHGTLSESIFASWCQWVIHTHIYIRYGWGIEYTHTWVMAPYQSQSWPSTPDPLRASLLHDLHVRVCVCVCV